MPSDDSLTIAQKLQAAVSNVMEETVNLLDLKQLEQVVKAIKKARCIFLFGVGSSGVTAEDAKNKLMRIGFQVDATDESYAIAF